MTTPTHDFARRAILAAALQWVHHTPQPDTAMITHHGTIVGGIVDNRRYHVVPRAAYARPVIVVQVAEKERAPDGELLNPIRSGDMEAITATLAELGEPVNAKWNGAGFDSGSFGLIHPAHPSLIAAVDRYKAGCQTHKRLDVDHGYVGDVFCRCDWYATGSALIVPPIVLDPAGNAPTVPPAVIDPTGLTS